MGLNIAGLTAVLTSGRAALAYAAVGDGPTAADQISAGRVATGPEMTFNGPAGAEGGYLLLFSAASGGTFYGFTPLLGDTAFSASGAFNVTGFEVGGTNGTPQAPVAPFAAGAQVGVRTGVSLADRSTLGAATGTETYRITHPVTGETADLDVEVWEGIRFTSTFTITTTPDAPYLFRNCRWEVPETAWTVEVDQANGALDQMTPLVVFEHCSFQGLGNSNIGLAASFSWVIACDIEGMATASPASGASDGLQGAAYSVLIDSNLIAGTNEDLPDPHSDGVQNTGAGHLTIWHCWLSAGASAGANAALRVGTEDGAVTAIDARYSTFDDGGYAVQVRGDAGGGAGITDVTFIGNRWTRTAVYGPVDFVQAVITEWTDNAYLDGEIIPEPA